MEENESYIGYVKYEGELVEDGLMDARKQAQALLGFDAAIRYFIGKQAPDFKNLDFEIPVRIRKGSWEALIPETAGGWLQAGLGVVATAYFTKAAQKMAEKDFSDFGVTDLFKHSVSAIHWFAKIGIHMGDVAIRSFEKVEFSENNNLVGISNTEGDVLYVPRRMLDFYVSCNPDVLEKLASNIEEGRKLTIGAIVGGEVQEVSIEKGEKGIFCKVEEDEEDDILFPELAHGDYVVLDGEVTRENKTSNSMGFKYQEHILTAHPDSGSIVRYKPLLFLKCRLYGTVNRLDEKGRIGARRPKLFFSHLEPLEVDGNYDLFR